MNDSKTKTNSLFIQEMINSFCYFAPITLLAVFLYSKGIAVHDTASIMLIGSIASRWGRILIAPIFSHIDPNYLISLFQLVGCCGYLLLGIAHNFQILLCAIILIGFFYGNNSMLIRVLNLNQSKNNTTSLNEKYAYLHVATNIASAFGPFILNIIYYKITPVISFLLVAVILGTSSIYSLITLKNFKINQQTEWFQALIDLLLDSKLFIIYLLIVSAWFFYAQVFVLAPALIVSKFHMPQYIWSVACINGIVVILCSVKLNQLVAKTHNLFVPIFLSFLFSLAGFTLLLMAESIVGILFGVIFISLSEIMFIPGFQSILGNLVQDNKRVAIFAINSLCLGIGEGVGYYYGTTLGLSGSIRHGSIITIFIYILLLTSIYLSGKLILNAKNNPI